MSHQGESPPAIQGRLRTESDTVIVMGLMCKCAGPVSPAANTLLWLCLDGLRGTQQCSADELARLSDALRVVESTAALQRTVQQVRLFSGSRSRSRSACFLVPRALLCALHDGTRSA